MFQTLVTGGAGYIGSHTMVDLIESGHDVVCIDNFDNSSRQAIKGIEQITGQQVTVVEGDICDMQVLQEIFQQYNINAIIHFAALKSVGESVEQPLRYYQNNVVGMLNLISCMETFHVQHFIFSSSCSVYGNADVLPVLEDTPWQEAESPYARTKQICENMIQDCAASSKEKSYVILRYFNPAGAHNSIIIGENAKNKASNIVPVITEVAVGKRTSLQVYGSDYNTRDGTCVRDYIHIMDLARAHTLALEFLISKKNKEPVEVFNLGSGTGSTVLEVIRAFEKVSGKSLVYDLVQRREGDVEAVYANYDKAAKMLGWAPTRNIESIMDSAWKWELARTGENF
ncbi:MAG: UDP-glucose 4-epimerase GalE [Saprospiraceae bacterium]|nr:UDP-glucose 4-epimerase GalE [Saprospiraceae bacterium]